MAIYSLNHKAVGKATQEREFTAAAHVKYITRDSACREVLGNRMPVEPRKAQTWLKAEETADRKNARVCDKVMIALPRELDQEQRTALVRDFAERVTQGKAPWLAAVHDKGKDRQNPHCHLVFRDRDTNTGKRCLHMSAGKSERALLAEKGIDAMTTDRMRVIWEHVANEHLENAGYSVRIDHRTLEAQGIERKPTLHEGVQSRQMTRRGERPTSKVVNFPNAPTARSGARTVDYRAIDGGRTRQEYNAAIIHLSESREKLFARNPRLADNLVNEDRHRIPQEDAPPRYSRDAGNHSHQRDFHAGAGRASGTGMEQAQGARRNNVSEAHGIRQTTISSGQGHTRRAANLGDAGDGVDRTMQENFDEEMKKARTPAQRAAVSQKYWEQAEEVRISNGVQRDIHAISEEEQKRVYELCDRIQKRAHQELSNSDEGRTYLSKGMGEARERLHKEYSAMWQDKGLESKPEIHMSGASSAGKQEKDKRLSLLERGLGREIVDRSQSPSSNFVQERLAKLRENRKDKRLKKQRERERDLDL